MVWCGEVWCGMVWCGMVWCGMVWCGEVREWCGEVWCGRNSAKRQPLWVRFGQFSFGFTSLLPPSLSPKAARGLPADSNFSTDASVSSLVQNMEESLEHAFEVQNEERAHDLHVFLLDVEFTMIIAFGERLGRLLGSGPARREGAIVHLSTPS